MKKAEKKPDAGELRVLILEDNPADAELVEHELRRAKIVFTSLIVEGKRAFSKALADFQPQVILSDFKLPEFDGQAALAVARLQAPDIPFIFVSGSIGEEKAIDLLSQGATDYIFKDNLARLGPAVNRVIETARLKLEKKNSQEELQLLAQAADRFLHINDLDRMYDYLAQAIRAISGADYLLLSLYNEERQGLQPKVLEGIAPFHELLLRKLGRAPEETILLLKDMSPAEFADFVSRKLLPAHEGLFTLTDRTTPRSVCRVIEKTMGITTLYAMGFSWENQLFGGLALAFKKGKELRNIPTIEALANLAAVAIKRLLAEKSLRESKDHLLQSEEYYRTLVKTSPDAIIIVDAGGRITFGSDKTTDLFGIPPGSDIVGVSIFDFVVPAEISRVQERMVEILSGRSQPDIGEYRMQRQDRRPFWGEVSSAPLHDGKGRDIGLLLVCRDISERTRAEEQIRYQASLLQDVSDAIIATDVNGAIRMWNRAAETIYGWKTEQALNMPVHQLLSPTYRYQERSEIFEKLERDGSWSGVIIHHHRDGRPLTIQSSITNLKGPGGEPAGMVSINSDITERKRAEAEFLRERVFLEKLVETAPEGIVISDNQGRVLKVNSEFARMFGYDSDEAPGKLIDDLVVPPQYREEAQALNKSVGEGKKAVLESIRSRRDGSLLHVSIIIAPIHIEGEQVAVYAIYQDISERKRAEAIQHIQYEIANAMVTAETFFSLFETVRKELSALFDTTNFLVAMYDEASGMLSAPFEKDEKDAISQWPAEKSLTGLVIKQKRSMLLLREEIWQLSQSGAIELIGSRAEAWLGVPLLINEKMLGAIVVQSYNNADAYDQSSVTIMEIIASQLSVYIKRKQTELELHESEAQYRAFFNTSRDCVYITSPAGRWLSMNDAAVELFGYSSREELSQVNISNLYANPEERAKHVSIITELGYTKESPVDLRKKDGTVINALITEVSRYDTDGKVTGFQGTIRDITERQRSEELIRASLKEKEVLLQEIHHRVKNNLQIISGLLTLQADQAAGRPLADIFRESQDRIRSIALIHEKLYRSHNLAEIAFDEYLRALTENLFISHSVPSGHIAAKFEMEPMLLSIEKAIPLGLIVNELVSNALKHAFPAGRRGEIRISLLGYQGAQSTASATLPGVTGCELIVADDGIGMPTDRASEKEGNLGMKLVSMLSRQLQAELTVKSGSGTEIRLFFPGSPFTKNSKNTPAQEGA